MYLSYLTGYLLGSNSESRPDVRTWLKGGDIEPEAPLDNQGLWRHSVLHSTQALLKEEFTPPEGFRYSLVFAESTDRVLLLARSRKIVDYILASDPYALNQKVYKKSFDIDRIAALCRNGQALVHTDYEKDRHAGRPGERYQLTSIHADLKQSGNSIRSMSLYGDDVTNGDMFRVNEELMSMTSCGIRRTFQSWELARLRQKLITCRPPANREQLAAYLEDVRRLLRKLRDLDCILTPPLWEDISESEDSGAKAF